MESRQGHAKSKPSHVVVLCHPAKDSFNAAVARAYCETVTECGQEPILRDLYRMNFDPVLKDEERPSNEEHEPAPDVAAEIALLSKATALVLIYPIWFGTPPAMLKGYVDRVLGASFGHRAIRERRHHPFLSQIHFASVTTSGNSRPWLEEQGGWLSLRNIFDHYLTNAFSMASDHHLHLDNIVEGLREQHVREELFLVADFTRKTCARVFATTEPGFLSKSGAR